MRKLASIQKILNIRPIPGADAIEAIDVLGWTVVAQKGQHTVGDLVIYFEVDSFLNATDPRYASFEERFTNWGDKRGMRLKSIKLRKQLSQGLILPIRNFYELNDKVLKEDDDVTEILKIEKWEPLHEVNSNAGGIGAKTAGAKPFPSFIRKTDQERVQNRINHLPVVAGKETFEKTIKLDGSSMTVFHVNNTSPVFEQVAEDIEIRKLRNMGTVRRLWYKIQKKLGLVKAPTYLQGVCSRNIQLDPNGANHFSEYVSDFNVFGNLLALDKNYAVQGELIGASIQENYEKVVTNQYYVYDVFDIDAQKYLLPKDARAFAKAVGLAYVPVLDAEVNLEAVLGQPVTDENARQLIDLILTDAEGPGMNPGVKREGVVYKSNTTEFSFKAISNSYLLKKG